MKNLIRSLAALVVFMLPAVVFAATTSPVLELAPVAENVLTVSDAQTASSAVLAVADAQSGSAAESGFKIFGLSLSEILIWAFAIVGGASAIVRALIPLAELTATEKDDNFLAKANSVINWIKNFLDKWVALNPNQSNARR